MSKRLFLLVLVAALLSGGPAMGQTRKGKSHSRKAKTEQKSKRTSAKSKKKTVEDAEETLVPLPVTELNIVEDEKVKADEIKTIDELKQTETTFGQKDNWEGTQDRTISRTIKEEIIIEEKMPEKPEDPNKVFNSVEQMPRFPDGEAALMKYISKHMKYPSMAAEENVQGRVIVQFVVEKDGSIGVVKVVRSVEKSLDKEAIRLVKSLPKFIPGRQNGEPVRVWYTLPVTFKLTGDDSSGEE